MLEDNVLVSVILVTEDAEDDDVFNTFKNITEQTHKNIDIVISTFREDITELKEKCAGFIWMLDGRSKLSVVIFLARF